MPPEISGSAAGSASSLPLLPKTDPLIIGADLSLPTWWAEIRALRPGIPCADTRRPE